MSSSPAPEAKDDGTAKSLQPTLTDALTVVGVTAGSPIGIALAIALKLVGALRPKDSMAKELTSMIAVAIGETAPSHPSVARADEPTRVNRVGRSVKAKVLNRPIGPYVPCASAIGSYFLGTQDRDEIAKRLGFEQAVIKQSKLWSGGEPGAPTTAVEIGGLGVESVVEGVAVIVFQEALYEWQSVLTFDPTTRDTPTNDDVALWATEVAERVLNGIYLSPGLERIATVLFERAHLEQRRKIIDAVGSQTVLLQRIERASSLSARRLGRVRKSIGLVAAILVAGGTLDVAGVDGLDDAVKWVATRVSD